VSPAEPGRRAGASPSGPGRTGPRHRARRRRLVGDAAAVVARHAHPARACPPSCGGWGRPGSRPPHARGRRRPPGIAAGWTVSTAFSRCGGTRSLAGRGSPRYLFSPCGVRNIGRNVSQMSGLGPPVPLRRGRRRTPLPTRLRKSFSTWFAGR